jgi:hypothetical protein
MVSWGPTGVIQGDAHFLNSRLVHGRALLIDPDTFAYGPLAIDIAPAVVAVQRFGEDPAGLEEFSDAAMASRVPECAIRAATAARIADVLSWLYAIAPRRAAARHELGRRLSGELPWRRL